LYSKVELKIHALYLYTFTPLYLSNMVATSHKKRDKELLNQLQSILLKEDRVAIERLKETIDDPILLSEKIQKKF